MPDSSNPATLNTSHPESDCQAFEKAWHDWCAGREPPRWQQFLPPPGASCNPEQIFLLLCLDIEFRVKAGLPALLTERYFEHPRLQAPDACLDAEQQRDIIAWEYQQRWQNGQRARRSDYEAAFPQQAPALRQLKPRLRCPQCQKRVVVEETWQTLLCSRCGSESPLGDHVPPAEWERKPSDVSPSQLDLRSYELIEPLGKGGMGEVYRACDPALERDLAVKVLRADLRGLAEIERRFQREARITGSLQHPGIVSVYNLGRLPDGRLHYTMRLVRGRTFADILQEQAGKPEHGAALLAIFEKMCQAVAYAHSKRVLHRDLKPANVMVGRFGEVQVMDWGLAKLLSDEEKREPREPRGEVGGTVIHTEPADTPVDATRLGSALGTPAYMSPEQAAGDWEMVDERSDVFALGSILCEVLTGQAAYGGGDREEVLRRARRGDVAEALQRLARCNTETALVALCQECLAGEREERPRNAGVVADRVAAYQAAVEERLRCAEVERAEAQVKAREERKRRRWAVALGLVLLVGAGVSIWQAIRATNAESTARTNEGMAQRRLEQIEKANEVLASIFRDLDPSAEEQGGPSLRQQINQHLERVAAQLDEEAIGDPLTMARLQFTLGTSLVELGQDRLALELLSKAASTREAKLGADHPDTLAAREYLARAYKGVGRTEEAIALLEEILKLRQGTLGPDHPSTLETRSDLASVYDDAGRTEEAIRLDEETVRLYEAKLGPDHIDTLISQDNLAAAYQHASRLTEALRLHEQILKQREAKLGPDHPHTLGSRNNLATAYRDVGRTTEAIHLHEQNLKLREAKLGPEHPHTLSSRNNLAMAYNDAGRTADAIRLHEQNVQLHEAKYGPDHPNTLWMTANLGAAYRDAGRLTEALALLEKTLERGRKRPGGLPAQLAWIADTLATTYDDARQYDKAEALYRASLEQARQQFGADDPRTAAVMALLGKNLLLQQKYADAETLLRACLKVRQTKQPENWNTDNTRSLLGEALLGQQKFADTEPLLLQGYEAMKERQAKIPPRKKVYLTEALERLVRLYEATGEKKKAALWRTKLEETKAGNKNSKP